MEDFITFEQAKILKELGFDWKCTHYYDDNGTLTPSFEEVSADGGYEYTISINNLAGNFNLQNGEDDEWCSAPTLAQAQKWLREVKKSDILIDKENNFYIGVFWNPFMETYQSIEKFSISRSDNFASENGMYDFDTYEECLSKGITQLLNLLTDKTEN